MISKLLIAIALLITISLNNSCTPDKRQPELSSTDIDKVIATMTETMVHDVTNPPLASRFFSYACLAGYEVLAQNDNKFRSMHGALNSYPDIKKPSGAGGYSYQLAALIAMMETAAKMQPSGFLIKKFEQQFLDSCRNHGYDDKLIDSSKSYGLIISKAIIAYAKKDKYNKISTFKRYVPLGTPGAWEPTPPAYLTTVEPYFNTIRSFTLDTSSQFKLVKPIQFSTAKTSLFYKNMLLNYKYSASALTPEERLVAGFWDCNPFAVQDDGHMLFGLKKISPGAHWMGITGIACRQKHIGFNKAMQIYSFVAIGLMDSFICCWDEKYRSNRIRPETAIHKYIDTKWRPLLQTPPFPEYLSGHSCISATASVILTNFFGDNFHYTDNVESKYGLAPRSFTSFKQAAAEAGISRFLGGIHFKDAIDNGAIQGQKVGDWVLEKLTGH